VLVCYKFWFSLKASRSNQTALLSLFSLKDNRTFTSRFYLYIYQRMSFVEEAQAESDGITLGPKHTHGILDSLLLHSWQSSNNIHRYLRHSFWHLQGSIWYPFIIKLISYSILLTITTYLRPLTKFKEETELITHSS
jgi:hypothetical protein